MKKSRSQVYNKLAMQLLALRNQKKKIEQQEKAIKAQFIEKFGEEDMIEFENAIVTLFKKISKTLDQKLLKEEQGEKFVESYKTERTSQYLDVKGK